MANSLTGEFDLVAQISLPTVNRVLAVQHQGQIYLHSFRASLPSLNNSPDESDEITQARRNGEAVTNGGISMDSPHSGISPLVSDVRGFVDVQVSTPGISTPQETENNVTRVSVHYETRVRYTNTSLIPTSLPEFVHGELITSLNIEQIISKNEKDKEDEYLINVDLLNNVEVTLIPASGSTLSDDDISLIEQVIRNFLAKGFQPVNVIVPLPPDGDFTVRSWRFKAMFGQTESVVAFLANLQDVMPSPGAPASVKTVFLDDQDDFAIAISSEFIIDTVAGMIKDTLQQLDGRQFEGCVCLTPTPWGCVWKPCATYTLKIKSSSVNLGNGVITFTLTGDLPSNKWYAPDMTFELEVDFGLKLKNNRLGLVGVGDVRLNLSSSSANPFKYVIMPIVQDRATKEIESARDRILEETSDQFGNMLSGFSNILGQLRVLNAHLNFTGVDIRTNGVIIHGKLGLESPDRVHVAFDVVVRKRTNAETPVDEFEFNGLNSWIPGGTFQQYQWSGFVDRTEPHRFITKFSGQIHRQPKVEYLSVTGTQGSFFSTTLVSGQVYSIISPLMLNPLFTRVNMPDIRLPTPVITRLAPDRLLAYIDLRLLRAGSPAPAPRGVGNNLVVHFTGSQSESLSILRDALNEHQDKGRMTFVTAVVPRDGFEDSLSRIGNTDITLSEDPEGGWAQTFSVNQTPTTLIIDPSGNVLWEHSGALDVATLSAAFGQHLSENGEPVRWQQLRLTVKENDLFPDFVFRRQDGASIPLRRLHGRSILINFWTSWSEPCLGVLRQLQIIENQSTSRDLIILAINDGEDPQIASHFFQRNHLTLSLITDPNRHISRSCGINCWPTTVLLDRTRRVQQIQFGIGQQTNGF